MVKPRDTDIRFVQSLEELIEREDRAALATLRRSLGAAGPVAAARYVAPYVPQSASNWEEDAYYLTAGLVALHQIPWPGHDTSQPRQNLGVSFRHLSDRNNGAESVERRLVALLNTGAESLGERLRHSVSLLRAHGVAVDYAQLLTDIRAWRYDDRGVQRAWAKAFWANPGVVAVASVEPDSTASDDEDPA